MNKYIDFLVFKKNLNNNNILLFDAECRICHHKFNHILNKNQENKEIIISKIFDTNNNLLKPLMNSLLNNNENQINYIINILINK
jgi:hypothetical protein